MIDLLNKIGLQSNKGVFGDQSCCQIGNERCVGETPHIHNFFPYIEANQII